MELTFDGEYNEDDIPDHEFTAEEIRIFDERREKRLRGDSRVYSWHEAQKIITGGSTT